MNSRILATLLATMICVGLASEANAQAKDRRFGLGLILYNPTGVTFKVNFNDRLSLDSALGFNTFHNGHLYAHSCFLWNHNLASLERAFIDLYFGVGPKIALFDGRGRRHFDGRRNYSEFWFGARAPVGVAFLFKNVPIDVFVEIAAGLWIIERAEFRLWGAAGVRGWF